ncbi:MAG TPA: TIGR00645 family protein, partial [Geminicoccaceae bacterium]
SAVVTIPAQSPAASFASSSARIPMPERLLERLVFASRWLMMPFYLGLIVALTATMVKFVQELAGFAPRILELKYTDVILAVLSLLDLALVGALVLMVVFSGYENFIARINPGDAALRQTWMGGLDFGGQKLKLVSAIVAISGIDLLKRYMNIESTDKADLAWLVGLHLTFVVSGVVLALMDFIAARGKAAKL